MSTNESHVIETVLRPKEETRGLSGRARKNILFVTNTNEYGGTESHLLELVHRLREPKVQISIVCLGVDFLSKRLAPGSFLEGIRWRLLCRYPKSLRNLPTDPSSSAAKGGRQIVSRCLAAADRQEGT